MTFNESLNDGLRALAELVERVADQALAGPDVHPPEMVDEPHPESKRWLNGWWLHAKQMPAHPKRIGGAIRPCSTVVHTTDMVPGTFEALVRKWQTDPGAGNAAHFLIGQTPLQGVVQFAPITRNANHAGGPGHGWFIDGAGKQYHPNLMATGIEIHNAGGLRLIDRQWRYGERVSGKGWVPVGPAFPASDVEIDPVHPLRAWHRFTTWQLEQLDALLDALEEVLAPMPAGLIARSAPERAPAWADLKTARVVGHVDLDAANRSDPWPPGLRWMRERAERLARPAQTAKPFVWRGQTRG